MAWDDKPPSKEELQAVTVTLPSQQTGSTTAPSWDATPPSELELVTANKIPTWDLMGHMRETALSPVETLEDITLGAAQGATLGFADELQGGIKATPEAVGKMLQGKPFSDEFLKKYREYQKEADVKYKKAAERSPWAYVISELASGFAVPVPGMGVVGAGKTLSKAALKQALEQGGKTGAAKAIGEVALQDAVRSAPVGAAMGLGYSEGNIDTEEGRAKLLSDAGWGAATGGVVGGALGVAGSTLPYAASRVGERIGKFIDSDNVYREFKNAYRAGKEGINLGKDETQRVWFGKASKEAEDLFDVLEKADKGFAEEINKTIKAAEKRGVFVNLEPEAQAFNKIKDYANKNQTIDLTPVKPYIDKLGINGNKLTPTEAVEFKRSLGSIIDKISSSKSPIPYPIQESFFQLKNSINQSIGNQVPGFSDANKAFAKYRENVFGQILAGDQTPAVVGDAAYYANLRNPELGVQNKLIQMIHGAMKEGAASREAKSAYQALSESLKKTDPRAFEFMGMNAEQLLAKIKTAADRDALIQDITKTAPQHGIPSSLTRAAVGGIGSTGKSYALKLSNKAGLYGGKIISALGTPITMTKKAFYDMPLDMASSVADVLATHDNAQIKHMGEALAKAIANKDQVGRNAVLFSIMQNPTTRNMFNFTDEEKK